MSLSEALSTTAMTMCRSSHAEALQATVSEGLAQGPYVAARARFEPTIFRSKGIDATDAPLRSTMDLIVMVTKRRRNGNE